MTPVNTALWLPAKRAALKVGPAAYTAAQPGEIVIRNRAVAINPLDQLTRSIGGLIAPWLHYPAVLGSDVAGEVVEVGAGVARFRVGDRVLGHAVGFEKSRNTPAEGAFQAHTVLLSHMAAPIHDALSFEAAAVLPLGLSTAACGLFQQDYLALRPPAAQSKPAAQTLLVWGGSTSVGSNAIQLAAAAGYEVFATASPHNFEYVKRLGAAQAFDYRSPTVVGDLIDALRGRRIAGAVAIGLGSAGPSIDVVGACEGTRFVAMATPPVSFDDVPLGRGRLRRLAATIARMGAGNAQLALKARRRRVRTKFIWGGSLVDNEVGALIYEHFLPAALAERRYIAAPEPLAAGHGLGHIPAAMDFHRRGVSARKVVVTL